MTRNWIKMRTPSREYPTVLDIPFEELSAANGIRYWIFDVDNTLVCRGSCDVPPQLAKSLRDLVQRDVISGYCLLSNVVGRSIERVRRVVNIAEALECDPICAFWPSLKPKREPFEQALRAMGATADQTAVVGDQVFTDILGARRLGMFAIKVTPLGPDHPITRPRRLMERGVSLLRARFYVDMNQG